MKQRQVGVGVLAALLIACASAWHEARPERRRMQIARNIATLQADARSDAADRVRELAACTADGVEFGAQSAVALSCWEQLRLADIARASAHESRESAVARLQDELDALR